ncbi:MAG: DNA-directed RNA polymerase subunit beta, partial [Micrococcaceae bacterium]|nr:DNA-directed RNA polymerase subunit beta [Micrococcaceae bacterium]
MVASSTSNHQTASSARTAEAAGRISFAKIHEPLDVPNLLALQVESFDWLVGNDNWKTRLETARAEGITSVADTSGLAEIFEEISPIEDFQGTMSLSFSEPEFADPKYTEAECKDRDATFAAPLYVKAEFMNNNTGEIKQQTVFMGDFPLMTGKGTFIINGTERVV